MSDPLLGLGQTFRRAGAIRTLPENSKISFAVRLESDTFPIRRPDGITIGSSHRELARCDGAAQLIDPDVNDFAVIACESDALAIRRNAREPVCSRRHLQDIDRTFTIHERKNLLLSCCRDRSWNINQRSVVGDAVVRGARIGAKASTDSFDDRGRSSCYLHFLQIKWDRE